MPSYSAFPDEAAFAQWIAARTAIDDPYSYAITDRQGRALGITALLNIRTDMRTIEVGHIVYAPALQRTPLAAQYILARYVFDTLDYPMPAMRPRAVPPCATVSPSGASSAST